jgi:NAD(P)H-flavin reductase
VAVITVPVVDVRAVTPRSRLLTVALNEHRLPFVPGQAVMLGAHGRSERRPYSVACSPEYALDTGVLELLVSVEPDGSAGTNLGRPAVGMLVDVEGPFGGFTLPTTIGDRVLFVAGGTGIAPLRSMLDHLLRQRASGIAPKLSLLYSARRRDEFAFIDELQAHADAGTLELHQTVTREEGSEWAGRRGRIGREHFEAVLHDPSTTFCVACGPDALVRETVATLRALGVPEANVRTESWAATA